MSRVRWKEHSISGLKAIKPNVRSNTTAFRAGGTADGASKKSGRNQVTRAANLK
jgi:hypothetical protein